MVTNKKLMKASEVGRLLNVSSNTVLNWAKGGLIPCIKIGGTTRFCPDAINDLKQAKYLG